MRSGWPTVRFGALGTSAIVVTTCPDALDGARAAVEQVIADVDAACSRFRGDSELTMLNAAAGRPVRLSPTLHDTLATALWAARTTGGLVDPTVGAALRLLGYDRDFAAVDRDGPPVTVRVARVPGWEAVRLDPATATVVVPRGVEIDLGATAKAWCADRAAERAVAATGAGVLVGLGGDLAVAGPVPTDGWVIRVADRHDDDHDPSAPLVAISSGGLATSGTAARRWWRGGRSLHHIVDPATGQPASGGWRTVSVAAATCVDANVASTAAVVLGPAGPEWLADRGLSARLVADGGTVVTTGGWPDDEPAGGAGSP
jgi:thiamine biosynthesis lipoprotein